MASQLHPTNSAVLLASNTAVQPIFPTQLGKRLIFTPPVINAAGHTNPAVTGLRILLTKTDSRLDEISARLETLSNDIKHTNREVSELAQMRQEDLAELKRELQSYICKSQAGLQKSITIGQNLMEKILASISSVLDASAKTSTRISDMGLSFREGSDQLKLDRTHLQSVLSNAVETMTDIKSNTENIFSQEVEFHHLLAKAKSDIMASIKQELAQLVDLTMHNYVISGTTEAPSHPHGALVHRHHRDRKPCEDVDTQVDSAVLNAKAISPIPPPGISRRPIRRFNSLDSLPDPFQPSSPLRSSSLHRSSDMPQDRSSSPVNASDVPSSDYTLFTHSPKPTIARTKRLLPSSDDLPDAPELPSYLPFTQGSSTRPTHRLLGAIFVSPNKRRKSWQVDEGSDQEESGSDLECF